MTKSEVAKFLMQQNFSEIEALIAAISMPNFVSEEFVKSFADAYKEGVETFPAFKELIEFTSKRVEELPRLRRIIHAEDN